MASSKGIVYFFVVVESLWWHRSCLVKLLHRSKCCPFVCRGCALPELRQKGLPCVSLLLSLSFWRNSLMLFPEVHLHSLLAPASGCLLAPLATAVPRGPTWTFLGGEASSPQCLITWEMQKHRTYPI